MPINVPALQLPQAPDILGEYGKALQLKNLMAQNAMIPGQKKIQQQTITSNQQGIDATAQAQQEDAAYKQAIAEANGDVRAALPKIMQVAPTKGVALQKSINEWDKLDTEGKKNKIELEIKKAELGGQLAGSIVDEGTKQQAIQVGVQKGALSEEEAKSLMALPWDQVKKTALDHSVSGVEQLKMAQSKISQEETVRSNKEREVPASIKEFYLAKQQGYKGNFEQWKKQNKESGSAGAPLSNAAIDQAADRYWQTGVMPAMGMGSAGAASRKAVMNRAAELHPEGSIAANSAEFKSNSASLTKLQTQFDAVNAFEKTAIKNIDRLIENGKAIPELGARFANTPVRAISSRMIGTEAMAKFHADLLTAQTEAAKVLNSANANGVLSDSARKEAQEILDGNLPYPAMVAAAKELKNDMENRRTSYQDQITDIQGRLGIKGGAQSQLETAAPSKTADPLGIR